MQTHPVTGRLKMASPFREGWLHSDAKGSVEAFVGRVWVKSHHCWNWNRLVTCRDKTIYIYNIIILSIFTHYISHIISKYPVDLMYFSPFCRIWTIYEHKVSCLVICSTPTNSQGSRVFNLFTLQRGQFLVWHPLLIIRSPLKTPDLYWMINILLRNGWDVRSVDLC